MHTPICRFEKYQYWLTPQALCIVVLLILLTSAGPTLADQTHGEYLQGSGQAYSRTESNYAIPNISLRDQHENKVQLQALLDEQNPVVLQFIFTSCETVCPMLTAMTSQAQTQLRELDSSTRIISISIDPDHDTPSRLSQYAKQFSCRGDWYFLTGEAADVRRILRAFQAMYTGDNKMNHKPYTFMRAADTDTWIRLIGLMGASSMVAEYRGIVE